jgi:lipoate-protein ligase B
MELEIGPGANVQPGSFCLMISPEEFLASSLNNHLDLQRFQALYVCGNRSGILDRLHRRFANIDVRRAFTAFQLLTVLEEVHHTLTLVEHDPLLYEGSEEMAEYIAMALKDASRESAVVLYSPMMDRPRE